MALRVRHPPTTGQIPEPVEIGTDKEGRITEQSIAGLNEHVRSVALALNGNLSMGDGTNSSHMGNIDGQTIEWTFKDANTQYEIPHGLGRVPTFVEALPDRAAIVYTQNRGGWGVDKLYLACNVANTFVVMRVT